MRTGMNKLIAVVMMMLGSFFAVVQTANPAESKLSPDQQSIERANKIIASKPNDCEAYNALALALSRRAPETSS